jgi:hypothetical protein
VVTTSFLRASDGYPEVLSAPTLWRMRCQQRVHQFRGFLPTSLNAGDGIREAGLCIGPLNPSIQTGILDYLQESDCDARVPP